MIKQDKQNARHTNSESSNDQTLDTDITLEIQNIGYDGAGCGYYNNTPVFVKKVLPGEMVSARLIKKNSKYSVTKLIHVLSPSDKRIEPLCPHFAWCCGCDYMHTDYTSEISIKKEIFAREWRKVEKEYNINLSSIDVVTLHPVHYRNKMTFDISNGKLCMHDVFLDLKPIDSCMLVDDKILNAINKINNFNLPKNASRATIHSGIYGVLISIQTNASKQSNIASNKTSKLNNNTDNLIKKLKTIYMPLLDTLNKHDSLVVDDIVLAGNKFIEKEICGIRYCHEPMAFCQINDDIATKLYYYVNSEVSGNIVLNAYSGAGLLSVILAKSAKNVYGIELNKSAHLVAEKLKEDYHTNNLTNICGKCEEQIEVLRTVDTVVLDPPRAGCDEKFVSAIAKNNIQKIVYISCSAPTMIRDLVRLKNDYVIESVKLFDMFPRTQNIESVVILKRK